MTEKLFTGTLSKKGNDFFFLEFEIFDLVVLVVVVLLFLIAHVLTPQIYLVKTWVYGRIHFFLIFALKHILCVLVRTA